MSTLWEGVPEGAELTGTCGFRFMSHDPMADAPATARAGLHAGGHALVVEYTWVHPEDGPQEGVLMVGGAEDDPANDPSHEPAPGAARLATMTWMDSWHQQPYPLHLSGSAEPGAARTRGTYAGTWGWEVDVEWTDGLRVVMRNDVPAEAIPADSGEEPGPYVVMDLRVR